MFILVLGALFCYVPQQSPAQQRLRALQEKLREFREAKEEENEQTNEQNKRSSPHERLLYEFERTRDPKTGDLPDNIIQREQDFAITLPNKLAFTQRVSSSKTPQTSLQGLVWQNIGPNNVGGRTRAFAIDLDNPALMLAGGVSGGMWRSLDSGASWIRVSAPSQIANVTCIAQDSRQTKPQTWYYGTGELLSTTDRRVTTQLRTLHPGNGIFKSTDNGATWKPLQSTLSTGGNNSAGKPTGQLSDFFHGVWTIVTDPSRQDSDVVLAACYGGIMRSNDGGASWKLVLGNAATKSWTSDIVVSAQGVFYAGLGSAETGEVSPNQGVWRSMDGINWIKIGNIAQLSLIRRIRLALAPSNPNALYVFAEAPSTWANRYFVFASRNTFFRYTHPASGSGSGIWEDRTNFLPRALSTLAGYAVALAVHPREENTVILGGTDLYATRDGGTSVQAATLRSWRQLGGYPYTQDSIDLHPDMHNAVFSNTSPNLVFVANDGGVSSADITSRPNAQGLLTWKPRFNGLVTSQFYYIALDRQTRGSNIVIGGLQDNSCFFTTTSNPTQGWTWAFGGDGMSCAVLKPRANNRLNFAASSQYGFIYQVQSDAAGNNAEPNFWWTVPDSANGQPLFSSFCTLFITEPASAKELYVAMQNRIMRYNDITKMPQDSISALLDDNWYELRSPRALLGNAIVSSLGMSTALPQHRIFAGTSTGRIIRIDRANEETQTVREVTSAEFPRNAFVSSISVDALNGNRVIAAFSNYNIQSLLASNDGGETWTAVGGNLEEKADGTGAGPSVRCVKIVSTGGKPQYFAGTTIGLFSADTLRGASTEWRREGAQTLGNVMVEHIDARESDGRIVVGTHGNGVYAATVGVSEPSITAFAVSEFYPNPVKNETTVRIELPARQRVTATLYNVIGQEIMSIFDEVLDDGVQFVRFDLQAASLRLLAGGKYYCRIRAGERSMTKQLMLLR